MVIASYVAPTAETPHEDEPILIADEIVVEDTLIDKFEFKVYGPYVITAYCPCEKCCGVRTGITASGTIATEGRTIAVDTTYIPYGTKIEIEGIDGIFIAEDCGGAVKGNKLDIFFNSHEKAVEWGKQIRNVYIRRD